MIYKDFPPHGVTILNLKNLEDINVFKPTFVQIASKKSALTIITCFKFVGYYVVFFISLFGHLYLIEYTKSIT